MLILSYKNILTVPKTKKDVRHFAIKCKLKSLLKYSKWESIIKDKVQAVNEIWIETYSLFNLYILHSLENNSCPTFDQNTIGRCVLFVLGLKDTIRCNDPEYEHLDHIYNTIYLKIGNPKISQYSTIKSIKRPFEYLSAQMIVNIHNHIKLNFSKFQKSYLKAKVFETFSKLKISKGIMYSILGCVQHHINKNVPKLTIMSKKLLEYKDLDKLIPMINNLILNERKFVPKSIIGNVSYKNLKKNCTDVIQYFGKMITYLENNEKKRFSVLPQIGWGYTYVKFDSRFLSTIYDEWMASLLKEATKTGDNTVINKHKLNVDLKQVGIKHFEENYKYYYRQCFNLDKFGLHSKNSTYNP